MPGDPQRVLYLVISGVPAPEGLPSLITLLQAAGWRVVVFSTPTGTQFADLDELERLTGEPVRWEYRMPGTGSRTPPADVVLACPLSFNSVNKFAHGHADNFAVGLLCEMAGYGVPVVVLRGRRRKRRRSAIWSAGWVSTTQSSHRYSTRPSARCAAGTDGRGHFLWQLTQATPAR